MMRAAGWRSTSATSSAATSSRASSSTIASRLDSPQDADGAQLLENLIGSLFRRQPCRLDADLRMLRWLVGRVDAGEILELSPARLLIEPFRVPLLGHRQWRIHEDLEELLRVEQLARAASLR